MSDGEQPSNGHLRIVVADEEGRSLRATALASWLRRVAPARARGTISIALVSDRRIRALNRAYRKKDYATDVLSFPAVAREIVPRVSAKRAADSIPDPPPPGPFLGDIVIARGVARRQAREAGHDETTEVKVLALHGLLHLLGYDHERDDGRMRRLEQRLRRKGGLREGLIERARGSTSSPRASREGGRGSPRSPRAPRQRARGPAGSPRASAATARPEPVEGRARR